MNVHGTLTDFAPREQPSCGNGQKKLNWGAGALEVTSRGQRSNRLSNRGLARDDLFKCADARMKTPRAGAIYVIQEMWEVRFRIGGRLRCRRDGEVDIWR